MDYGIRSGKILSLGMPKAPQGNIQGPQKSYKIRKTWEIYVPIQMKTNQIKSTFRRILKTSLLGAKVSDFQQDQHNLSP